MIELVTKLVLKLVVDFAAELVLKPVGLELELAFKSVESWLYKLR